jgi:hypothetical protein
VTIDIDKILSEASRVSKLIEPAFALVGVVQAATNLGGPMAATAIKVLEAAVKAIGAGAEGKLTNAQVMAELAKLKSMLASNDAAADAALRARFPTP